MPDNNYSNQLETTSSLDRADQKPESPLAVPRPQEAGETDINLEDAFSKLFKSSVSGTGEEELLRIASDYALQINAKQIKCLLFLENMAEKLRMMSKAPQIKKEISIYYKWQADYLSTFVYRWLDLKRHNNSDVFVMRGLDSISLRKFINENTLKVNIEK